jgi:hypothetical protein
VKKEDIGHPSVSWFKGKTNEKIQRDIRFIDKLEVSADGNSKLNKENDYFRCLIWEYKRTLCYTDKNYRKEISEIKKNWDRASPLPFPLGVLSWPKKPYLSHSPNQRIKWAIDYHDWEKFGFPRFKQISASLDPKLSFDELTNKEKLSPVTLFSPDTHTELNSPPIDFNGITLSEVPMSTKVPVVFHLDVDLTKSKLKVAVVERWSEIESQILKAQLERPTAKFMHNQRTQLKKLIRSKLTHLGLYRLLTCCGKSLSWHDIVKTYGDDLRQDKYSTDELFRKEVEEHSDYLFPDLKNLQKIPLRKNLH